jgi:hypothetical protein
MWVRGNYSEACNMSRKPTRQPYNRILHSLLKQMNSKPPMSGEALVLTKVAPNSVQTTSSL